MVQQVTSPTINSIINEENNNPVLNIDIISSPQPQIINKDNNNNKDIIKNKSKSIKFLSIIIVCLITILYTTLNELSQFLVTSNYNVPFTITWLNTLFYLFSFFGEFVIIKYELYKSNNKNETIKERFLKSFKVENIIDENGKTIKRGISLKRLFILSIPMSILFVIMYYIWFISIAMMEVNVSTALYQSASIFCFIFSIFILKEKIRILKTLSIILFTGGIVCIGIVSFQGDSNNNYPNALTGQLLLLLSASLWALYEVLTAKFIGETGRTILHTYLGFIAIINLILGIPVILIFNYTGFESFYLPDGYTFGMLILNGFVSFALNYLINFGLSITSPLFVRAGELMTVPCTLLFDIIIKNIKFNLNSIPGYILIVIGFALSVYIQSRVIKKQEKIQNTINNIKNDNNQNNNNDNNIKEIKNEYNNIVL